MSHIATSILNHLITLLNSYHCKNISNIMISSLFANTQIIQEISNDLDKQGERLCINFYLMSQFPNIVMERIIDSCGNT